MTSTDTTAFQQHVRTMTDAALIAIWDAVDGEPNEEQEIVLAEIQRRDLDL